MHRCNTRCQHRPLPAQFSNKRQNPARANRTKHQRHASNHCQHKYNPRQSAMLSELRFTPSSATPYCTDPVPSISHATTPHSLPMTQKTPTPTHERLNYHTTSTPSPHRVITTPDACYSTINQTRKATQSIVSQRKHHISISIGTTMVVSIV